MITNTTLAGAYQRGEAFRELDDLMVFSLGAAAVGAAIAPSQGKTKRFLPLCDAGWGAGIGFASGMVLKSYFIDPAMRFANCVFGEKSCSPWEFTKIAGSALLAGTIFTAFVNSRKH